MVQTRVKTSSTDVKNERITGFKILGVGTSLREGSYSTRALKILLDLAAKKYGAEIHLLELRKTTLPLYDPSINPIKLTKSSIQEVTEAVIWADAFVLASPDYHGSMSGTMKNFLDYFWEEFAGKTFGYLCTSHEKGLTVMDQMRTAVRQCYGWSMPYGVSVNGERDFNTNGEINNTMLSRRLNMLARDLVVYGRLIKEQFRKDLAGDTLDTFAARYRR